MDGIFYPLWMGFFTQIVILWRMGTWSRPSSGGSMRGLTIERGRVKKSYIRFRFLTLKGEFPQARVVTTFLVSDSGLEMVNGISTKCSALHCIYCGQPPQLHKEFTLHWCELGEIKYQLLELDKKELFCGNFVACLPWCILELYYSEVHWGE